MFPPSGSITRCLPSLHAVRAVPVPALRRYYGGTTTPAAPAAALSFLRPAVPRLRLVVRSARPKTQDRRPGFLLVRQPTTPTVPWKRQVLPSSWGTPIVPAPCSSTPAGRHAPNHRGAAARPPLRERRGLPHWEFRSSIAWLLNWLSAPRRVSRLIPAQDSLPGVGQTLLGGLSTRRVPTKGFRSASLHLILLSQASLGAIPFSSSGIGANSRTRPA